MESHIDGRGWIGDSSLSLGASEEEGEEGEGGAAGGMLLTAGGGGGAERARSMDVLNEAAGGGGFVKVGVLAFPFFNPSVPNWCFDISV